MVTETQDITLEEENILNTMTATPLLPEQTIKKTVSKDGMLTSYDADGNILSSEPYEEPNMKPFLDSLKYYVDLAEKELSKQEVKSQSAFAKIKSCAMPNRTNVWQMDDGNIVIEEIISNHSENGMRVKGVDGQMRSRTITNPEMDKTLRFELYQGNQMVTRRTYQYNGSEKLKNLVKIKGSTIENPSGIISEVLFINERGIPRIRKTQEEYKQNQMIVHFCTLTSKKTNMKRIILFLLISFTFILKTNAEKKVFYVHGTFANQSKEVDRVDNKHKLGVYRKAFTDNNGILCWYDSDDNLNNIASYCFNTFIKPQETNNDIILVAHSMGGSVSRAMLNKSNNIKGLITAGTANNGNVFFKKLYAGEAWSFFENMNTKKWNARQGSNQAIANALFPNTPFALAVNVSTEVSYLKSLITNEFFKLCFNELIVPEFYKDYPCLNDMAENSTFNNNLNSQKINIPYINIYGAEDAWPFVRLLGSQLNSKKVYNIENIDKTYDEGGVNLLNLELSLINITTGAHDVLYDVMSALSVVIWKYKSSKELIKQARYNWDDLYNYYQTDMHNEISKFNGSYKLERRTYTYRIFGKTVTSSAFVPVVLENDGMNSDKTVMLPETMAGPGGIIYNVRVAGVNHMEMGNHKKMREIIETAFKTNTYGSVFNLQQTQ